MRSNLKKSVLSPGNKGRTAAASWRAANNRDPGMEIGGISINFVVKMPKFNDESDVEMGNGSN